MYEIIGTRNIQIIKFSPVLQGMFEKLQEVQRLEDELLGQVAEDSFSRFMHHMGDREYLL